MNNFTPWALWVICVSSRIIFFFLLFFLCICSPLWLCGHASFSRRIVKKKSLSCCGKAEVGWDQALLEIWETDIKSTVDVFFCFFFPPLFHAPAPAESPEPLLPPVSKSWLLPPSLLWCEDLLDSCSTGKPISPNCSEHHSAAAASFLETELITWPQFKFMDAALEAWQAGSRYPQCRSTGDGNLWDVRSPLFWGVKTIRRLYCPFPGWALTHPVYWKEFNRRQLGPTGAWSHPKSLVMIALFYTGCSLSLSLGS